MPAPAGFGMYGTSMLSLWSSYDTEKDTAESQTKKKSKKVQKFETRMEETMEKLQGSSSKMEEAEKEFKDKDDDVNNQARRLMLLEDECTINVEKLATTVLKLAVMSKDAEGLFLEQFAKLGLFQKVHSLSDGAENDDGAQDEGVIVESSGPKEDAKEILAGNYLSPFGALLGSNFGVPGNSEN